MILRTPGRSVSVVALASGNVGLKTEQGAGRRVFITTMPKAGTYLIGQLLREAGLTDLEIHVDVAEMSDYRGTSNAERLAKARDLTAPFSYEQALSLVHEGQFAVGHIPYDPHAADVLRDFAVIAAFREPRLALVSMMRFEERRMRIDPDRGSVERRRWLDEADGTPRLVAFLATFGPELIGLFRSMLAWVGRPGVTPCRFETLMGDFGPEARDACVARLLDAVGVRHQTPAELIGRSVGRDTLTFSGERSRLEGRWTQACEDLFASLGGLEVAAGIDAAAI